MCWHRQPVTPWHNTASIPLHLHHQLYFASCVKALGYRNNEEYTALCDQCYFRLRTFNIIRTLYVKHRSHYVACGHTYRAIQCACCPKSIMTLRPLRECNPCFNRYLNFLAELNERGNSLDDQAEPIILHISGDEYY